MTPTLAAGIIGLVPPSVEAQPVRRTIPECTAMSARRVKLIREMSCVGFIVFVVLVVVAILRLRLLHLVHHSRHIVKY